MSQVPAQPIVTNLDTCFKNVHVDPSISGKWYWKDDSGWNVPTSGVVQFEFIWSQEFERTEDPAETVRCYYRSRRVALTMGRFVTLYGMYVQLRDSNQKAMMIRAMHDQILLKMCHLKKLLDVSPDLLELLVNMLYSAVESMDSMALFDLIKRPDASRRFRKVARAHFFFNDSNPTDHYVIDLEIPAQYSVAEKVAILNAWEMLAPGVPDTTQYGRGEGVRNCVWEGTTTVKSFMNFSLPPSGRLTMDYVSPKGPNPRMPHMGEAAFAAILDQIRETECSFEDRVCALRSVSHRMTLDSEQTRTICLEVPNRNVYAGSATVNEGARRTALEKIHRATTRARALTVFGACVQKSAFQIEEFNPRVEAFVCFFNRTKGQTELCTRQCLYDDKQYSKQCALEMRKRLGVLRTFDAMHCADPLSNGGNRFVCRMWIHEEWQLARFLVKLASVEEGANMVKTKWSERKFMEDQGYDFLVPEHWLYDMPMIGTFTLNYVEEKAEYRNVGERRFLAEQIMGWGADRR
jgi:hypothetical protein